MTKSLGNKGTIDGVQKSIWSNIVSASSEKPISRFGEEVSLPPETSFPMSGSVREGHGSLQRQSLETRPSHNVDTMFQPNPRNLAGNSHRQDVLQYVGASLIKQHSYSDSMTTYQYISPMAPYLLQPQHLFLRPQLSLPESSSHNIPQMPILIIPWKQIYSNQVQRNISNSSLSGDGNLNDAQKRALELTGAPLINYNANTYASTNSQQDHNLPLDMLTIKPSSNYHENSNQHVNKPHIGPISINAEPNNINLDALSLNSGNENSGKLPTPGQKIVPFCNCCTICYPQCGTKNDINKAKQIEQISMQDVKGVKNSSVCSASQQMPSIQTDNSTIALPRPKPPLKRTNGTTYMYKNRDCTGCTPDEIGSITNNKEKGNPDDAKTSQKWYPIEIESEDEERFLPSNLLADSNSGRTKEYRFMQNHKVGIEGKDELVINDPSKKYNTLLPHLWRVCRKNNRKEKVSKAKSFDYNSTLRYLSNEEQDYATKLQNMSDNKLANALYLHTLEEGQKKLHKSVEKGNEAAVISNTLEVANDSAYSSDENNIRNLDDVVIKKPVKKSSSWNVPNMTSLEEKETEIEEEHKVTTVSKIGFNEHDDKEEDSDGLGGKFCLFPVSTDSDPISALRNNWRASTSYLSEDNQFNNEEESKQVDPSDDNISKISLKENATNNDEEDINMKKSNHLQKKFYSR